MKDQRVFHLVSLMSECVPIQSYVAKKIIELNEKGKILQPLAKTVVSQLELDSSDCKRAFYIMGFLQEFFSFNFKKLHLLDLTGCYGFFPRAWYQLGGTASTVESNKSNQKIIKTLCELEQIDLDLYLNIDALTAVNNKFNVVILDEITLQDKNTIKKLKKLVSLIESCDFFILNEDKQQKSSIIKQLLYKLDFEVVKQTNESSLGINLAIYSKTIRKYTSIDGAFEVPHVFAFNDSIWTRVNTCIKQRPSLYFKPNPTAKETVACMQASVCNNVPRTITIQPSKLVLTDTGAFPLSHLPSRKGINWEVIYQNALTGINDLHRHDIIHGNINSESIWINTHDQSVWLMCFEHAIINGEGWEPFHAAKWGKNKTPKIDVQGLNEVFTRLK